ncbi:MAG: tetratricopeptide repeat protein, partial [Desulfarculaceae bacterium]
MFACHVIPKRMRLLVLLFILGLVNAIASAQVYAAGPSPAGKIVHLRGRVQTYTQASRSWLPARPGQVLLQGDAVSTGPDGWAALLLADETLIQINRNSKLILKKVAATAGWLQGPAIKPAALDEERSLYQLDQGEIWLRNKNRKPALDLNTPTVTAAVRGTELNLSVSEDRTVTLTVLEGLVAAWNQMGRESIAPGEQLIARPGQPLLKRLLVSPGDAVQWVLTIPPLFGPSNLPLISSDQVWLARQARRLKNKLEARPGDLGVQLELAQVLRDQGHPQEAADLFSDILKRQPKNPQALTGLAWTLIDRRQPQKAWQALAAAGGLEPLDFLGRSLCRLGQGQLALAEHELKKGLARHPGSGALQVQLAFVELSTGRISAAQRRLSALTTDQPGQAQALSLLCLARLAQDEKEKARGLAQRAVQTAPQNPLTWLTLSYAHQALFDLEAAQEATQKALDLQPDYVLALVNQAKLWFATDHLDQAWEAIAKGRSLEPKSASVLTVWGFITLAKGDLKQAHEAFRQAAGQDPGLGEPHLGSALVLMRQGRTDAALEEMTVAVLLEPRRAMFLSYWGKMLFQIRRFEQARQILDQAAALDPLDPTPHLYQAFILHDLNRPSEAVSKINQAIALNHNRAVYRSRFLLDKDLAIKNVTQSIIYSALGLEAWAYNRALASIKHDYLNSAGHVFAAGALFGLEGRSRAAASEALLGRILQPANLNTFNQFNEYTYFFEKPTLDGSLGGTLGNKQTHQAQLFLNGALPSAGLAFQALGSRSETDGWRRTNFHQENGLTGMVKWDPDLKSGLMLAGSFLDSDQGDKFYPR